MSSKTKKPYAVFTMAHNENVFLPIWLGYYSQYIPPIDIYVIDHDSSDGSITKNMRKYKFQVHKVHTTTVYDHQFMLDTVMAKQHELSKDYEIVIYSDTDELIIVDPKKFTDLKSYLQSFKYPFTKSISRSVFHQPEEPKLNLSKKVLSQRKIWYEEFGYNKVNVSRIPLIYGKGLHKSVPLDGKEHVGAPLSERPILLHLNRMDYDIREQRGLQIQRERWGGEGPDGIQQLLSGENFRDWFYGLPYSQEKITGLKFFIETIPKRFKDLV